MFTARRILTLLVVILVILLALGVLFWYLAYGAQPSPPDEREVTGLNTPVTISWLPEKVTRINTSNEEDFYRGIGYAHGVERGWSAVLWRQTGLGALGDWFDEPALGLDSLTRKVGFRIAAQSVYQNLSEDEQLLLEAYADGMNAALYNREIQRSADFVLLDHAPAPWEPWHSLIVERLFAWLVAADLEIQASRNLPASVKWFRSANTLLRDWLQIDGYEHSIAWAASDSTGTTLYQRHITGATVLPLYHEIVWQHDQQRTVGATIPGFPAFISGHTAGEAWAILPRSTITIQEELYLPEELTTRHERLETASGDEYLLTIEEAATRLLLEHPPLDPREEPSFSSDVDPNLEQIPTEPDEEGEAAPVDSTWFVYWEGLQAESDFSAWRQLLGGSIPSFSLITGDGVVMDSAGSWSVIGDPVFEESFAGGVMISQDPWGSYRSEHLQSLIEPQGRNALPQLVDQDSSTWAAETSTQFLASIDSLEVRLNQSFEEGNSPFAQALTYLRNWNYYYTGSSISATIFDRWINEYWSGTGASLLNLTDDEQPIYFEDYRRLSSLRQAVEHLTDEFGSDLEDWRWELTAQETRHFPTWSPDGVDIRPTGLLSRTRYAPINLPARGHISSLSWGPSLISGSPPPPTAWESWVHTLNWDQLSVRRRYIDVHALLGRYRHREKRPDPVILHQYPDDPPTTTLIPRAN